MTATMEPENSGSRVKRIVDTLQKSKDPPTLQKGWLVAPDVQQGSHSRSKMPIPSHIDVVCCPLDQKFAELIDGLGTILYCVLPMHGCSSSSLFPSCHDIQLANPPATS